jgi:hypothetical protein
LEDEDLQLIRKSYIDDETEECVLEKFFIDGREVTLEEYEKVLEIDEFEEEDTEDQSAHELIEDTVQKILNTDGCSYCIKEILYEFYNNVVYKILNDVEDEE